MRALSPMSFSPGSVMASCVAGRVSARRPSCFSLLRQRKVAKRKASRRPGPCGLPCAARCARGARKLASLKHARPFSRAPLRCSARPHGGKRDRERTPSQASVPCPLSLWERAGGRALSPMTLLPGSGLNSFVADRVSPRRATCFLLLRQKKVSKEKASRRPGPCGLPCAARCARGARKLASLKHARPFSRAPLRCSARPHGGKRDRERTPSQASVPCPLSLWERAGVRAPRH